MLRASVCSISNITPKIANAANPATPGSIPGMTDNEETPRCHVRFQTAVQSAEDDARPNQSTYQEELWLHPMLQPLLGVRAERRM